MKESSLKVVVAINDAYPILQVAFSRLSPESRAERLRSLATIGLHLEGGGTTIRSTSDPKNFEAYEIKSSLEPVTFAVVLNEAQPILYDALKKTPTRFRAERLRTLALLGFHLEGGKITIDDTSTKMADTYGQRLDKFEEIKNEIEVVASNIENSNCNNKNENVEEKNIANKNNENKDPVNRLSKGARIFARCLG